MTLHELEKKLIELDDLRAELKGVIEEVKGEVNPTPPHPRWVPSNEDTYYVIGTCGDVFSQHWTCIDIDKSRLSCGNIFMTREAAEFAAERRKVLAEMWEWSRKWDDEFSIRYNKISGIEIFNHCIPEKTYGEMRFATKEDAINCVKAVGEDRIKKYYFMIPE